MLVPHVERLSVPQVAPLFMSLKTQDVMTGVIRVGFDRNEGAKRGHPWHLMGQ